MTLFSGVMIFLDHASSLLMNISLRKLTPNTFSIFFAGNFVSYVGYITHYTPYVGYIALLHCALQSYRISYIKSTVHKVNLYAQNILYT